MRGIVGHLVSLVTALVVIVNLGFWMTPVFLLALLKLLFGRIEAVNSAINSLIETIYRIAAATNSFWMVHIIGVRFTIDGHLPRHPSPIIVVNHQTWFDIPVLQHVVTGQGPVLKFLIKKNLIWVPIVGWICYALNFPRLYRGGGEDSREKDYAAIASASSTLSRERGALLIFAEGTRFTREKHKRQQSPFNHLLMPRPGGLKIALDAVDDATPIVDMTIDYQGGETNFWQCLNGANRDIRIRFETFSAGDIQDARNWLMARWAVKDADLEQTGLGN